MKSVNRQLRELYQQMQQIALEELERRARAVLRGRNPARSFYMGNGEAFFINRLGQPLLQGDTVFGEMKWADSFYDFLGEWDEVLYLTYRNKVIAGPDAPAIAHIRA